MTMNYKPPELFFAETHYVSTIDVWSIGCIMGELLRGRPMFNGTCELEMLMDIFSKVGTPVVKETHDYYNKLVPGFCKGFPKFAGKLRQDDLFENIKDRVDMDCLDLLKKMLDIHPTKRIPCCVALEHPWFKSIFIKKISFNKIAEKFANGGSQTTTISTPNMLDVPKQKYDNLNSLSTICNEEDVVTSKAPPVMKPKLLSMAQKC